MKKIVTTPVLSSIIAILLSACGSAGSNAGSEREDEIEVNEIQLYSEHLGHIFTTSTKLQTTFSTSLDGLYTGTTSESQFAKIITDSIIETSRDLVKTAESYNFAPEYFEINQSVVTTINMQIQLFLDAVSTAKEPEEEDILYENSYISYTNSKNFYGRFKFLWNINELEQEARSIELEIKEYDNIFEGLMNDGFWLDKYNNEEYLVSNVEPIIFYKEDGILYKLSSEVSYNQSYLFSFDDLVYLADTMRQDSSNK